MLSWKYRPRRWVGAYVGMIAGVTLVLNLGGLRDRIFSRSELAPIHSIAVLPLTNLSGDPSQDYFSDGMTDEMITALAENHSLRVVSRTSAMQFKGVNKPISDIAQSLGVDGILEGSVMRANGQVHVNLQLIYAPTDTHVWAQSYDRDSNGAILLPDEVAQTIATEAKVTATPVTQRHYISSEAHEAYLRGRFFSFNYKFPQNIEYFQKAIQLQPDYAAAWDAIGVAYLDGADSNGFTGREACTKAEETIQEAISFDDSVTEVHTSMAAFFFMCKWDFAKANEEALRAIALAPNDAEARVMHAQILNVRNRNAEALEEAKLADEIAPHERPWMLGYFYIHMGRIDDAINELRFRAEANPSDASVWENLSEAYWIKGMYKESENAFEKSLPRQRVEISANDSRRAFERGGEQAVAHLILEDKLRRSRAKGMVASWDIALQYGYLGDKEHALEYLQRAYWDHNLALLLIQREPLFDFLHSDARYRTLVKNIGLQPAW